jgi:hypothetical protein
MANPTISLGGAVELQLLKHGTIEGESEGDLRLSVSVRMDEFEGAYDRVWIACDDWRDFIASLNALERTREGTASLIAMSPDEFELHLQIIDLAGHLVAHGFLSRYHFFQRAKIQRSRIAFRAEVDPSLLRELVSTFTEFGKPVI